MASRKPAKASATASRQRRIQQGIDARPAAKKKTAKKNKNMIAY